MEKQNKENKLDVNVLPLRGAAIATPAVNRSPQRSWMLVLLGIGTLAALPFVHGIGDLFFVSIVGAGLVYRGFHTKQVNYDAAVIDDMDAEAFIGVNPASPMAIMLRDNFEE